jgi:hypothetical protein
VCSRRGGVAAEEEEGGEKQWREKNLELGYVIPQDSSGTKLYREQKMEKKVGELIITPTKL